VIEGKEQKASTGYSSELIKKEETKTYQASRATFPEENFRRCMKNLLR
jgi:hypothetical protein